MTGTPVKVIVAAERSVYDLLNRTGANWDLQTPVDRVDAMWDAIDAGTLDPDSKVAFLSDRLTEGGVRLDATIVEIASTIPTFIVSWDKDSYGALISQVRRAATSAGQAHPPNIHLFDPTNPRESLDEVRRILSRVVEWPEQWPPADVDRSLAYAPATGPDSGQYAQEPAPAPAPAGAPAPAPAPAPQGEPPAYMDRMNPAPTPTDTPAPAPVATTQPVPQAEPAADPVPEHRQIREELASAGQHTIAFTSSKGGAGKTTTAICVAAQIAKSSKLAFEQGLAPRPLKVVVVDMDIYDGQVGAAIGTFMPTVMNIRVEDTWDEETVTKNLAHSPRLGIDALLAPTRARGANDLTPSFYRHVIRVLQHTHDVVILDTSVRYTDELIADVCYKEASGIVFVTTLVNTAVLGMARAIREITDSTDRGGLGISRNKIGVVVNQSILNVGMTIDEVVRSALGVNVISAIPLASFDVMLATNHTSLEHLLTHPTLGRAYHQLATVVMPGVPLPPTPLSKPASPQGAGRS